MSSLARSTRSPKLCFKKLLSITAFRSRICSVRHAASSRLHTASTRTCSLLRARKKRLTVAICTPTGGMSRRLSLALRSLSLLLPSLVSPSASEDADAFSLRGDLRDVDPTRAPSVIAIFREPLLPSLPGGSLPMPEDGFAAPDDVVPC